MADREVWKSSSRRYVRSPELSDVEVGVAILLPDDREASGAGDVCVDCNFLHCRFVHSWISVVVVDMGSFYILKYKIYLNFYVDCK